MSRGDADPTSKEARLAQALRANLRRRKTPAAPLLTAAEAPDPPGRDAEPPSSR